MERSSEVINNKIYDVDIFIRPYTVDLISYDIIFGKFWLAANNPDIDWRKIVYCEFFMGRIILRMQRLLSRGCSAR